MGLVRGEGGGGFDSGFFDYNDLSTASSPIAVTAGAAPIVVTNDGLGPFTNKSFAPSGVSDLWDALANDFDFSELPLGATIDIRLDISVITTKPNQEVYVNLQLGQAGAQYLIPFADDVVKSSGPHSINRFNGVYLGDENTRLGGGKFMISSDEDATVVVSGWYIRVITGT